MSVIRERSRKVLYVANSIIMDVVEFPLCLVPHKFDCYYGIARLLHKGGFKLVCGDFEDYKGLTS